jgi:hypothetical protein
MLVNCWGLPVIAINSMAPIDDTRSNQPHFMIMKHSLRILVMVLALSSPKLFGQSAPLTNYKTGIDTIFSGASGTDYQEEYLFSDPLVSDRKVVYIKSGTTITLAHNARNVSYAGSGTYAAVANGNNGSIMYKIDRDLQRGREWGDANGATDTLLTFAGTQYPVPRHNNPTYTAPFTLASLTYDGVTPVVGTTGPIPATPVTNVGAYYWRGILDSVGDEWHVLTVADNDTAFITDPEGGSSDGKLILFVVNPKTPCLTITVTGNAQFYTTPPKIYFTPKIHDQTTYFSANTGTISFWLKDINGNNVFYRINGGAWSAGAANPVLHASDFNLGTNTLEYYYAGNAAFTKTRIVVKDPAYPSAGEPHGNLMWKDAAGRTAFTTKMAGAVFQGQLNNFLGNGFFNPLTKFDNDFAQGKRICYGRFALQNALVAMLRGWNTNADGKSKTSALYAKQMLLESERNIDPVGFEINHSNRCLPTRELFYRGYYDVDVTFSLAFAYDLLIANFKSTQFPSGGGITNIEDYFIRDQLAGCAFEAMMQEGNYTSQEYLNTGMWGTARNIGGMVVALAMPSYSTPYYGTSGVDGNTTVYPYTPFPNTPLTWKKVFIDNDAPLVGYPNLNFRLGIEEYQTTAAGTFLDRVDYFSSGLMGHCFAVADNLMRIYYNPSGTYPNLQAAWLNAASGTLTGTVPSEGTKRLVQINILNRRFGSVARIATPWMRDFGAANGQAESTLLLQLGALGLVWYDSPTAPTTAKVNVQ